MDVRTKPLSLLFLLLLLLLLTGSLNGCGFHFRGVVKLPSSMASTYIQDSRPPSAIAAKLKAALTKNNSVVVKSLDSQTDNGQLAVLYLSNERFNRRLLSSGSSTLVKEYQLNYSITFEVKTRNGDSLLAAQTVNTSRNQTFDENQVLAKISEQDDLRQEMTTDATGQILRRLQAMTK